jgi:hypothetical protein
LHPAWALLKTNRLRVVKRHYKLHGQAVIASLLVGLVLLLDAMAACPALHEMIHKDAGKADHDCAVTMFAHGKVDSATVEVAAVVTTVLIETVPQVSFSVFAPAIENLPAGRAPPVLPAVS